MDIICQEMTEPTSLRRTYARGIETDTPILEMLDNFEQTTIDGPGAFLLKAVKKQLRYMVGALCSKKIINLHEYQLTVSVIIHKKGESFGINPVKKPHTDS